MLSDLLLQMSALPIQPGINYRHLILCSALAAHTSTRQAKYIATIQSIVYCIVLETADKNLCSDISILGFLRKATLKCGDDLRFPCSGRTNNDGDIRRIECCIQRQRLLLSRLSAFEGFQRIGRQPIHCPTP